MPEIIYKGKLQTDMQGLQNVSGRAYGDILADTTALAAIKPIRRQHGMLAVVAPAALWVYNSTDTTAADATHIAPAVGAGRWVKTT